MSNNDSNRILHAQGVHKTFLHPLKVDVLKGIDLTVYRGQSVAITGRSGNGKSTLLQVLGTLEPPCKGAIQIANQWVSHSNQSQIRNRHLAFVFQSFHLLEDYSAIDNVLMPARIARMNTAKGSPSYRRGCELLEQVGLSDRMHFHTKLLSGGEKQRIAIARALCNNPDLLLADEPSGNLDKQTAELIHKLLLDYTRQEKAVVIVTHDPNLANLCSHKYLLQDGLLLKHPF